MPKLVRFSQNPIIVPKPENIWESRQTFNSGAILLKNKIHLLYRAIGKDEVSRLGYATSENGFIIDDRLSYPVYEHDLIDPTSNLLSLAPSNRLFEGVEDPRIVAIDKEDSLYMTYTATVQEKFKAKFPKKDFSGKKKRSKRFVKVKQQSRKALRILGIAMTSIKIDDFLQKRWCWKSPILISPLGEIHKNWVIFPEKINGLYAILHSVSPKISITYRNSLEFKKGECIRSYYCRDSNGKNCWEHWMRGAGAPPLKTIYGWLLFYHAMNSDWSKYKVGALILDINNPTKILYRAQEPVLEPETDYENGGFKAGVVYVTGAVIKNGEILVYYGASDSYVSVAYAPLKEFLRALIKNAKPKLNRKNHLKENEYDY